MHRGEARRHGGPRQPVRFARVAFLRQPTMSVEGADDDAGAAGATRRERFGFRKEGTGREPRVRDFGLGA